MSIHHKKIERLPRIDAVQEGDLLAVSHNGTAAAADASLFRGEPAKINGNNTIVIRAGSHMTLDQSGNVLTIDTPLYDNATISEPGLMSAEDKAKLNGVETGAQVNVIEGVTVNGTAAPVSGKTAAITVPTNNNQLTNGAGYQTAAQVRSAIDEKVSSAYKAGGSAVSVAALPALLADNLGIVVNMSAAFTTTADFVEGAGKTFPAGTNVVVSLVNGAYKYDVLAGFVDLSGKVDKTTTINGHDLSSNVTLTKSDVGLGNVDNTPDLDKPISTATQSALDGKVNVESGKGLSTNDYTTQEKNKLTAIMELLRGMVLYRKAGPDNPLSISDGYPENLRALSVDIQYVQSGSGDPYPPGGSKNLMPLAHNGKFYLQLGNTRSEYNAADTPITANGVTITFLKDDAGNYWGVNIDGTCTGGFTIFYAGRAITIADIQPGIAYTYSGAPAGGSMNTYYMALAYFGADTGNGSTATLDETILNDKYNSNPGIYLLQGVTYNNLTFRPMLRRADTSPDYVPYANIRPVSGWNSASVTRYGENAQDNPLTVQIAFTDSGNNNASITVYGGTLDVANGVLTVTQGYIASYAGETLPCAWISDRDVYAAGTLPTTGAQVVYELAPADYQTYQLTAAQLATLGGSNTISAALSGSGAVTSTTAPVTVEYRADPALALGAANNN